MQHLGPAFTWLGSCPHWNHVCNHYININININIYIYIYKYIYTYLDLNAHANITCWAFCFASPLLRVDSLVFVCSWRCQSSQQNGEQSGRCETQGCKACLVLFIYVCIGFDHIHVARNGAWLGIWIDLGHATVRPRRPPPRPQAVVSVRSAMFRLH